MTISRGIVLLILGATLAAHAGRPSTVPNSPPPSTLTPPPPAPDTPPPPPLTTDPSGNTVVTQSNLIQGVETAGIATGAVAIGATALYGLKKGISALRNRSGGENGTGEEQKQEAVQKVVESMQKQEAVQKVVESMQKQEAVQKVVGPVLYQKSSPKGTLPVTKGTPPVTEWPKEYELKSMEGFTGGVKPNHLAQGGTIEKYHSTAVDLINNPQSTWHSDTKTHVERYTSEHIGQIKAYLDGIVEKVKKDQQDADLTKDTHYQDILNRLRHRVPEGPARDFVQGHLGEHKL
jgi:hypothetical protein